MIGAGIELIANAFFIMETPGIIGTNCFFLRVAAIAAIVVNAALNGRKLRQKKSSLRQFSATSHYSTASEVEPVAAEARTSGRRGRS